MDKKPLAEYSFSFIVPVYNVECRLFEDCLNSIISLNFAKYELIIVNDGSTLPEVEEICLDFAGRYGNVKYFVQENQGSAVARNTGLEHAAGEYVMFVDADDWLDEGLREEFSRIDGDFDCMCMWSDGIWDSSVTMHKDVCDFSDRKDELYGHIFGVPGALTHYPLASAVIKCFPMKFIRENNIRFQPQLRAAQDHLFMLDVYYAAKKILYRPILSYHRVVHEQSITHKMNFNMMDYSFRVHTAKKKWIKEHSIDDKISKFSGFGTFHSALALTYLNKDCRESISKTFKGIAEQYDRFEIGESIKRITFRELVPFRGSKQRMKLFVAKTFGKYGYSLLLTAVALARRYIL